MRVRPEQAEEAVAPQRVGRRALHRVDVRGEREQLEDEDEDEAEHDRLRQRRAQRKVARRELLLRYVVDEQRDEDEREATAGVGAVRSIDHVVVTYKDGRWSGEQVKS